MFKINFEIDNLTISITHLFATLFLGLLLINNHALFAQSNWLPPVTFSTNTDMCDDTSFKLIFFDDFNDTTLSSEWRTFHSWLGMQPYEHENWSEARVMGNGALWNTVALDKNVVVSDGTLKLKCYHEPVNWNCDTCTTNDTRYFSGAFVETPFYKGLTNDLDTNWFSSGMFEVRMRMDTFMNAHHTVWLYHGYPGGVDEIDMVEAYGRHLKEGVYNYFQQNTYNLHAFAPIPNDYNCPNDANIQNKYPGYDWVDELLPKKESIEDWHTYRCRWDTAKIDLYIDNSHVNTIWKYNKNFSFSKYWNLFGINILVKSIWVTMGSGCLATGTYNVTYGYPWKTDPSCNLRLTLAPDGDFDIADSTATSTFLGQSEVDYIKIWQRHPKSDGHEDICPYTGPFPHPNIEAPTFIPPYYYKFAVSDTVSDGLWYGVGGMSLQSTSGKTATFVYLPIDPGTPYISTPAVHYKYADSLAGCPSRTAHRVIFPLTKGTLPYEIAFPVVLVKAEVSGVDAAQIMLTTLDNIPDMGMHNDEIKYEWTVIYNSGSDTITANADTFIAHGKYISTPFWALSSNNKFSVKWQLRKSTLIDSSVYNGSWNSQTLIGRQSDNDSLSWYLTAAITDSNAFMDSVQDILNHHMADPNADTSEIYSMIEQARFLAIEPYLTNHVFRVQVPYVSSMDKRNDSIKTKRSNIYPNPTNDILYLKLSDSFLPLSNIRISIFSQKGYLINTYNQYFGSPLDIIELQIGYLSEGVYFMEVNQDNYSEKIKFIKKNF